MTDISIADDLNSIERLSAVAAREFASSCAQRVLPVIETLASGTATATASEALRWLEAPEVAAREGIERRIRSLDEASTDDSNDPRYYAMRALGILMDAIGAADAANAVLSAQSACEGAADLADDLDFILEAAGLEAGVHLAERRAAASVLAGLASDASVARRVDAASIGAARLAFRRAAKYLSTGESAGPP